MPSSDEIEKQLEGIHNWLLVANKKYIMKGLGKLIKDGESIINILEGLYKGAKISEKGKEHAGILCLTDRKLFFVTSELRKPLYEEVSLSDITEIKYEKTFSSIVVTIEMRSSTITFKTFDNKSAVMKFIDSITEKTDNTATSHEDNSLKVLNDINDTLKSLSDMNKVIGNSASRASLKPEDEQSPESKLDLENLNFLFAEAKKIGGTLSEYMDQGNDKDLRKALVDDMIILSSLCSFADGGLTEEELLFISMVMMQLNLNGSSKVSKLAEEMFSSETYQQSFKEILIDYWDNVSSYIKKSKSSLDLEDFSLRTLNMLETYDRENGTSHGDKIGTAMYTFSQCLMKADGKLTDEEEERLRQISTLISKTSGISSTAIVVQEPDEDETLETVMEKINALVGMENIKDEISTFINLIKVQKEREERKLPVTPLSLHAVFYGPPGTGKTTIARLLGKVYKCLGLLKKGQLIETDRAGLVAGFVGQTAINVDKVVQKALDGVLFIDEAYALIPEDGGKDFGQEAVNTILKRMEDHRDRLVVIVAGYPDEMKNFIYSNPGLKSRFSRYFYFDHYPPEELILIFDIFCKNVEFTVENAGREKLLELLKKLYERRDKTFGNGRLVRNIFEKVVERQANRIAGISPLTDEILCTITKEDIPEEKDLRV